MNRDFRAQGTINFAENRVDPDTGTWRLRGKFDNHDNALSPGLFVRIRLPIGLPHQAILISEEALGTDQGQKFIYIIVDDGKAEYRRVKVGRLHDGLRVIEEGLATGEKVVVNGPAARPPGDRGEGRTGPHAAGERERRPTRNRGPRAEKKWRAER